MGHEEFVRQTKIVRRYGATIVVMAFDEKGQAATYEEKCRICKRSYDLLVGPEINFPPEDIIFDPNILTIAAGMSEHNAYSVVLGFYNYKVTDIGVMRTRNNILNATAELKLDVIGLSGLITPSLDEMVYVAQQMKKRGMKQPLLIGGKYSKRSIANVVKKFYYSSLL